MNSNENNDHALQQELNKLKKEHQRLRDDKLRTEQDLENVTRQLDDLQTSAKKEYGTDDPTKLQEILAQKREQNEKMVAKYRAHLKSIDTGLKDVESKDSEA